MRLINGPCCSGWDRTDCDTTSCVTGKAGCDCCVVAMLASDVPTLELIVCDRSPSVEFSGSWPLPGQGFERGPCLWIVPLEAPILNTARQCRQLPAIICFTLGMLFTIFDQDFNYFGRWNCVTSYLEKKYLPLIFGREKINECFLMYYLEEYSSLTFSGGNVPNRCHKSIPLDARAEDESSDVKHKPKSYR